ncbi:transposase [uncultured Fusobacterium sp.]|uniref:RNA-guided endonuclease InsQ/TnpB family protein n=1 Tax=uncultured Fusobacterium sp. TaxID=159267 RepID=UPI0025F1AEE1|nr:transposase [uncultured Fusobacterium sp.]
MLKAYKIEIKPTEEQIKKINKTIGVCRFIYNFYIAHNQETYKNSGKFVSGMSFSKWLNNDFIPNNRNYLWIKDVSSKAVKQSIMNGEKAFKQFFKKETGFPKFKKKNRSNVGVYLPKNNKTDFIVERHRAKIPTLGFVRLKEFGYIPLNSNIKSGTITKKCDRYYISILVDKEFKKNNKQYSFGIGVDLGIKEFATVSDERIFKNINKTYKVKKLKKSLKKEQRKLSRKYESLKIRNKEEGGNVTRQNVQKQVLKVQKLHNRINNIRTDYINKTINELVKTKPEFINIEDLNISGMMKNRHLSKAIAEQKLYEFRNKLINKCHQNEIEVRLSNRFYASSKTCSQCGSIKKDLKLADRTYICPECGAVIDRDLNAAINLRDNQIYKIV